MHHSQAGTAAAAAAAGGCVCAEQALPELPPHRPPHFEQVLLRCVPCCARAPRGCRLHCACCGTRHQPPLPRHPQQLHPHFCAASGCPRRRSRLCGGACATARRRCRACRRCPGHLAQPAGSACAAALWRCPASGGGLRRCRCWRWVRSTWKVKCRTLALLSTRLFGLFRLTGIAWSVRCNLLASAATVAAICHRVHARMHVCACACVCMNVCMCTCVGPLFHCFWWPQLTSINKSCCLSPQLDNRSG